MTPGLQPAKYVHTFPIRIPSMETVDLIRQALPMLQREAPEGYVLSRLEWHRTDTELIVLCDATPEVRWYRSGLIWRGIVGDERDSVEVA